MSLTYAFNVLTSEVCHTHIAREQNVNYVVYIKRELLSIHFFQIAAIFLILFVYEYL